MQCSVILMSTYEWKVFCLLGHWVTITSSSVRVLSFSYWANPVGYVFMAFIMVSEHSEYIRVARAVS